MCVMCCLLCGVCCSLLDVFIVVCCWLLVDWLLVFVVC